MSRIFRNFIYLEKPWLVPPRMERFAASLHKEENQSRDVTHVQCAFYDHNSEMACLTEALKKHELFSQDRYNLHIGGNQYFVRSKWLEMASPKIDYGGKAISSMPKEVQGDHGKATLYAAGNPHILRNGSNAAIMMKSGGRETVFVCYEENMRKYQSFVDQYNGKMFKIVDYDFLAIPRGKGYLSLSSDEFYETLVLAANKTISERKALIAKHKEAEKKTPRLPHLISVFHEELNKLAGEDDPEGINKNVNSAALLDIARYRGGYPNMSVYDMLGYINNDIVRWQHYAEGILRYF